MKINEIFFEEQYSNAIKVLNELNADIIEIEPNENGRRFQIVQSTVEEISQKENRKQVLQNLLYNTDYIVTKLTEMQFTNNENFSSELARYQDTIQNRVAWRSELDNLLNE